MSERILQHKHCQICGKAVPIEEDFCSEECKEKMEQMVKKKRLWMYVFYALALVLVFMLIFSPGN